MNDADVLKRFDSLHIVGVGGNHADMRKLIQEDTQRWGEVIKQAGIKPE